MPFLAAAAPVIAALTGVAATGYGIYQGISSANNKPEAPQTPELPKMDAAPTPESSEVAAKAALDKKRRAMLLTGGRTILTSEAPSAGTTGKTLLGG
jgi:hypothetical protein